MFERRGEWSDKLIRQRLKEQLSDKSGMVWRGRDDDIHALFRQDRIGGSPVVFGLDAFGQASLAQSP
jgi:hypothetical protein